MRRHAQQIAEELKRIIARVEESSLCNQMLERSRQDQFAKSALLWSKLCRPGPPLHVALDWVGPVKHRSAIATLLTGDWMLGRYAANFYARSVAPCSATALQDAQRVGVDPNTICLACWHSSGTLHLDDEAHVLTHCPVHGTAREELLMKLSVGTCLQLAHARSAQDKLLTLLGSQVENDWALVGEFAHKVRQARRKQRNEFEALEKWLLTQGFVHRKVAWQTHGKFVCRHGVFWQTHAHVACPCMQAPPAQSEMWHLARWMPVLDRELKAIIAVPFDSHGFRRLGVLRAELRRLG